MSKIVDFLRDESAVTAIEYALIAGLMTLAITGAIGGLGRSVSNMFDSVSSNVMQNIDAAAG